MTYVCKQCLRVTDVLTLMSFPTGKVIPVDKVKSRCCHAEVWEELVEATDDVRQEAIDMLDDCFSLDVLSAVVKLLKLSTGKSTSLAMVAAAMHGPVA